MKRKEEANQKEDKKGGNKREEKHIILGRKYAISFSFLLG